MKGTIKMTREEAIEILQGAIKKPNTKDGYLGQAIDMAIQALSQETRDVLIIKSDIILHPDDIRQLTEEIKRGMENGVIIMQPYFEPLLVPDDIDIDIRIEQQESEDI